MISISENPENAPGKVVEDNEIDFGQMRFIDNYIPPLPAGSYNIEVTQTLKTTGSNDPVNVKQVVNQEFVVDAPRFAIPANEIHHCFPPPNSQGVFSTDLPQIVLTHRALPWERTIWEQSPETPWMALIVLDQEQIMIPQIGSNANQAIGSGTGSSTISLTELLSPSVSDSNVLLPDIDPNSLPDEVMQIQVLDITRDGFTVAVPTQDAGLGARGQYQRQNGWRQFGYDIHPPRCQFASLGALVFRHYQQSFPGGKPSQDSSCALGVTGRVYRLSEIRHAEILVSKHRPNTYGVAGKLVFHLADDAGTRFFRCDGGSGTGYRYNIGLYSAV